MHTYISSIYIKTYTGTAKIFQSKQNVMTSIERKSLISGICKQKFSYLDQLDGLILVRQAFPLQTPPLPMTISGDDN